MKEKIEKPIFSIVIAIYNVDYYLVKSIESVINQAFHLFEFVELILVNDGSTDNSEQICVKYQKKYPNNIIYIYQENQGVSAARNRGIEIARGTYINFLDGDDYFESNVLKKVLDFFSKNRDVIDVVAIPLQFIEARQGPHMLNHKFTGDRIIDVELEPSSFVMQSGSTFIERENGLNELRFANWQKYGEDASLLTDVIMKKRKYGVVKNTAYYYRKRATNTSALQNGINSKDYWLPFLKDYQLLKVKKYIKKESDMPLKYIQYILMYDVQWRLRAERAPFECQGERIMYQTFVIQLLKYIDFDVIYNQKYINDVQKYALVRIKNTGIWISRERIVEKILPYKVARNGLLDVEWFLGQYAKKLSETEAIIDNIIFDGTNVIMMGYLQSELENDRINVYLSNDTENNTYDSEIIENKKTIPFFGETLLTLKQFSFCLDTNRLKKNQTISLFMDFQGVSRRIKIKFQLNAKLTSKLKNSYIVLNNSLILGYNSLNNRLYLKKYTLLRILLKESKISKEIRRKTDISKVEIIYYRKFMRLNQFIKNKFKISFEFILNKQLAKYEDKINQNFYMDKDYISDLE